MKTITGKLNQGKKMNSSPEQLTFEEQCNLDNHNSAMEHIERKNQEDLWRKAAKIGWDSNTELSSTDSPVVLYTGGYLRARTEQATEIAALKAQVAELQSLPVLEGEPVRWQINFKDEHGTPRSVCYSHNAIGDYRLIDPNATCEPLYTRPAPFTPTTADMVTDEMLEKFQEKNMTSCTDCHTIVDAVNAYLGAKK
jgi:hypothetical protein